MNKTFKYNLLRKAAILTLFFLVGMSFSFAQEMLRITGTVIDRDRESMPGVNVVQKGTTIGTTTDVDGKYSISVPKGSILVFSYIGCLTQEITVNAQNSIDITLLENIQALDEVVVVGYGVQKKSSVTGAILQVKAEDMQNRTITRPEQAMQGKTAGVQIVQGSASPGSTPNVRIRGISSSGQDSGNNPLYVVDGRIMENIGGIDPNDIESMEILKDAASAAIYGVAAGNGVVLITTKKGAAGKSSITYDFQVTTQKISRIPKVLNSEQYIDYMTEAKYISMDKIMQNWDFGTNTDWSKVAFENSLMHRHNMAFQGGNAAGTYYLSLSYLNNDGPIVGKSDVYKRYTGTINGNYNIKPWLEVGTNNQIEYFDIRNVSEGSEYGSILMSVLQVDPLTRPIYAPNDLPQSMQNILNRGYTLLQDPDGNYYGVSAYQITDQLNPLILRDRSNTLTKGFNVNGTVYGNLKPIESLVITSRLAYRLAATNYYSFSKQYYASDNVKSDFGQVTANAGTPTYLQWENFINFTKKFDKHNVNVMVGTSFIESRNFGVSGTMAGTSLNDFGFIKNDPRYAYFAYATPEANKTLSGGEETVYRKLSYFGRLTYDLADKYFLQSSLRADAADTWMLPVTERWGYFPAVSVGWNVSKESFMKKTSSWMSELKLRGSWGQNGSTGPLGGYAYASTITSGLSYPFTDDVSYSIGARPSVSGNPELKWETSEQIDIGLDARFLRSRLSMSADYFIKKTKDLLVRGITASTIVGVSSSPINAGNIENKGLELELTWRDKIGNLNYSIRGNIATLKNKVTHIHESIERINGASFHTTPGITVFEEGYPAWYFRGYKVSGIDSEGNPIFWDKNSDGIINDSDRDMIGSPIPDLTYGLTLSAAWKGIDLTVFGTGTYGNDVFLCLTRGDRLQSNVLKEFYDDRWTPSNTRGTKPRPGAVNVDKYWLSDAVVYDGSFFKIKQIQLGYTLPTKWLSTLKITNTRAYVSFDDFIIFTKYPGFDPEFVGTGAAMGLDKGSYPGSRKVVFGLNITF